MKLAIMQPYFMPYIGYWQLINAVDTFVVYDNIKYTKKGWINRNRFLLNGADAMFSLPLKNDSDSLDIVKREIASGFNPDKLLNQFKGSYAKSPYFSQAFPLLERIVRHKENNLFYFVYNSIVAITEHLGINTEIKISSKIDINHELKSQDKVLAICETLGAKCYINAIGGIDLYYESEFKACGLSLKFIKTTPFEYPQFGDQFIPFLSIIDLLMFNSLTKVRHFISNNYELV